MKKIVSIMLSLILVLGLIPVTGIAAEVNRNITVPGRTPLGTVKKLKDVTIENLDAPYHGSALDKEITVLRALNVENIQYTMFGKELESYSEGDNISIVVKLKTNSISYEFDAETRAYWAEQGVYSDKTNIISKNEAEYIFFYTVPKGDAPQAETAHFNIAVPKDGEALPIEVTHPLSNGIKVKSVEWTPADEKADASKAYTVKITFDKEDNYVWADGFEDQAVVTVNGKYAPLERVQKSKFFYYYTEVTIQPIAVDDTDKEEPAVEETEKKEPEKVDETDTKEPDKVDETDKKEPDKADETDTKEPDKVDDADKKDPDKVDETGKQEPDQTDETDTKEPNKADKTEDETYTFPFADIESNQWYYESVKAAHKMGLINGKNATTYAPEDNMTFAEAVKLAACMNILYNGGDPNKEIAIGKDIWYSTYMNYALDNGIIDEDLTPRADENITRKEYVYIFSKALPAEAFAAKNTIPTGSIPDVKEEKRTQDKAIYLLYRAGILAGNDAKGTFNPSANITRAEVATILIRMMDSTARVNAPAELGK